MARNSIDLTFPEHLETLSTIADLRAFKLTKVKANSTVQVTGRTTFSDGLGAFYVWDPFNTQADDGNAVVRPTFMSGAGRWIKTTTNSPGSVVNSLGTAVDLAPSQAAIAPLKTKLDAIVYLRDFGADGTGATSAVAAFTAALASGRRVLGTPGDVYLLDNTVYPPADRELIGNGATIKLAPGAIGLRLSQPRCKINGWKVVGNSGLYAVLNESSFNEFSENYCTGNVGHYFFSTGATNVTIRANKVDGLTASDQITTAFIVENCKHVDIVDNQISNIKQGWAIQTRGTENFTISNNTIFQQYYTDSKTATAGQTVFTFNLGEKMLIELLSNKPKVRVQVNGKPLSPTTPNLANLDNPNIIYTIGGTGPQYTITFTTGRTAGEVVKLVGFRGAENIQINNNSRYGTISGNTIDGTADACIIALGSHLSIVGNKCQRAGFAGIAIYGGQDNITVTGNTIIDCALMDDGKSSPDNFKLSSPFAGGLFIAGENIVATGNNFINDSDTMTYGIIVQKVDMTLKTDGSAVVTLGNNTFRGNYPMGRIYIPNQDASGRANSIVVDGPALVYPGQLNLETTWVERTTGSGVFDPAGNSYVTVSGTSGTRVARNTSDTIDGGVAMQTVAGQYIDLTYTRMGMYRNSVVTVQFWGKNIGGNSYFYLVVKLNGVDKIYEVPITDLTWKLYTMRFVITDGIDSALRLRFGANFGAANIQNIQVTGNRL